MHLLKNIFFGWTEVWALLIPLSILLLRPRQPAVLKPVIVYLWLALVFNVSGDLINDLRTPYHFPAWLQSNNPIYNVHSITRFACFGYFFVALPQPSFKIFKKINALAFLLFAVINFAFFENILYPNHLSGNILTAESYLLLIYCMLYYLAVLNNDEDNAFKGPAFWVVTGLSIFVVVNFFVFLFYVPMIAQDVTLALYIWKVHNAAYVILCLFITRAFYAATRN